MTVPKERQEDKELCINYLQVNIHVCAIIPGAFVKLFCLSERLEPERV